MTAVPATSTPTAGTAFNVTLTVKTNGGGTDTTYNASNVPLTVTGAPNSPSGKAPVLPTNATFVNGVATVSVTLYDATSQTLTFNGSQTAKTTVTPVVAAAANIKSTTAVSSQSADTVNSPGVTYSFNATDAYGNPVSGQAVNFTLNTGSGDKGTYTLSSSSRQTGANGSAKVTVTSTSPKAGDTFSVTGTIAGTSTSATGGTTTVTAGAVAAISYVSPGTNNADYKITAATAISGVGFVVLVTDAYGNPVPNQLVGIGAQGGIGNWSTPSAASTDANGNATFTVSDSNAQSGDNWQIGLTTAGFNVGTAILYVQ